MQSRLAGDEHLATSLDRHVEEFARAAASDGHAPDRCLQITDGMQTADSQKLFETSCKLAQRLRLSQCAPAARAETCGKSFGRFQRLNLCQAEPFGELLIDARGGRIERGMWAMDR